MRRRPPKGLPPGMWEFPTEPVGTETHLRSHWMIPNGMGHHRGNRSTLEKMATFTHLQWQ